MATGFPTLADWLAHVVDPATPVYAVDTVPADLIVLATTLACRTAPSESLCERLAMHAWFDLDLCVPSLPSPEPLPSPIRVVAKDGTTLTGCVAIDRADAGVTLYGGADLMPFGGHGTRAFTVIDQCADVCHQVKVTSFEGDTVRSVRVEAADGSTHTWQAMCGPHGPWPRWIDGFAPRLADGSTAERRALEAALAATTAGLEPVGKVWRLARTSLGDSGSRPLPPFEQPVYSPSEFAALDGMLASQFARPLSPVDRLFLLGLRHALRQRGLPFLRVPLMKHYWPFDEKLPCRTRGPCPNRLEVGAGGRRLIQLLIAALDRMVWLGYVEALDLYDGDGHVRARAFPAGGFAVLTPWLLRTVRRGGCVRLVAVGSGRQSSHGKGEEPPVLWFGPGTAVCLPRPDEPSPRAYVMHVTDLSAAARTLLTVLACHGPHCRLLFSTEWRDRLRIPESVAALLGDVRWSSWWDYRDYAGHLVHFAPFLALFDRTRPFLPGNPSSCQPS